MNEIGVNVLLEVGTDNNYHHVLCDISAHVVICFFSVLVSQVHVWQVTPKPVCGARFVQ